MVDITYSKLHMAYLYNRDCIFVQERFHICTTENAYLYNREFLGEIENHIFPP